MVGKFLDWALPEPVRDRVVEMSGPLVFVLWLPHLVHGGEAPGQGAV